MDEYNIYQKAEKKVRLRLALEIHSLIFISVNIILFIINIIFTSSNLWSIIVMLSWGLGLVIHLITYYVRRSKNIAILIHLTSFLMVGSMLIFINIAYRSEIYWFIYPLIAFSISFTSHTVFYFRTLKEPEIEKRTWYIKRIENEANKIRKEFEEK